MEFKDYYQILGVDPEADTDAIKRAYRKLARKYHPDVSDAADAEDRFKEVAEAWEVLGDAEKRAAYDQMRVHGGPQGMNFEDFASAFGEHGTGGGRAYSFGGGGFTSADASQFSDFFRSIFGEETGFHGSAGFGGFQGRGRDVHTRLPLTLEEAYGGTEQTVEVATPEVGDDGRVRRRRRNLKVKIPAGVTEGQHIRLKGQGEPVPGGGAQTRGDLYVEVQLVPHPRFAVDGRDLTLPVDIAPWEAALGTRIEVETLGGRVSVKVPAGTSTGSRLRLKGRGLPGNPPGDQYLEFRVVVPEKLSERERELFEALADESAFRPRPAVGG